jgi:hypothetical protein
VGPQVYKAVFGRAETHSREILHRQVRLEALKGNVVSDKPVKAVGFRHDFSTTRSRAFQDYTIAQVGVATG